LPGQYTVKLTVNGRSLTQSLTVKMDPRVQTPPDVLAQQFALSMQCYEGMRQVHESLKQVRKVRAQLKKLQDGAEKGTLAEGIQSLDQKVAALEGTPRRRGPRGAAGPPESSLNRLNAEWGALLEILQSADGKPTTQVVTAAEDLQKKSGELLMRWNELKNKEVTSLNERLRQAKFAEITWDK
jgi:hypothetical protein